MRQVLELIVFLMLSAPIAVLPLSVSRKAGKLLGLLVYRLWGSRRRIATENLRAAVERGAISIPTSPEQIIRENFVNMGRSLAEILKVYYGLGDRIVEQVRVEGLEHIERAKESGRGVILIGGHCGNWELMQLAINLRAGNTLTVARKQNNQYIDSFIVRTRERYGSKVAYKQGAIRKLFSTLRGGGMAGILIDQSVLPDEGVLVDFLGAPAWTTKTPAAIAKRTSAIVIPVFIRRTDGGHVLTFHNEVELTGDETEDTSRMSRFIDDYIKENPSEWLWIHRRWKRTENIRTENGQAVIGV